MVERPEITVGVLYWGSEKQGRHQITYHTYVASVIHTELEHVDG